MAHHRTTTTVVALLATLALPSAASAGHGCSKHARGGQIVTKTKEAHVYVKGDVYWGCAARTRTPRRLPELDTVSSVRDFGDGRAPVRFTLGGIYVGYGRYTVYPAGGGGDTQTDVLMVDLRTGKLAWKVRATLDPNQSRSSYLEALVVKRNGSAGWINEHHTISVHRFSNSPGSIGRIRLDEGDDIDRESLALSADRTTLMWARGGQPKSAPLP